MIIALSSLVSYLSTNNHAKISIMYNADRMLVVHIYSNGKTYRAADTVPSNAILMAIERASRGSYE